MPKKKKAAKRRSKTTTRKSGAKRSGLTFKVTVPAQIDLQQGPDLGALTSQQRLELASMGARRSSVVPSFVGNEKAWRAAVRQVAPRWKRYEFPYAAVAFVYLRTVGIADVMRPAPLSRDCEAREPRSSKRVVRSQRGDGVDVERVELDELGYDERGKYYGVGEPLWRVTSEHPYIDQVVRARTGLAAKTIVMSRHQH